MSQTKLAPLLFTLFVAVAVLLLLPYFGYLGPDAPVRIESSVEDENEAGSETAERALPSPTTSSISIEGNTARGRATELERMLGKK